MARHNTSIRGRCPGLFAIAGIALIVVAAAGPAAAESESPPTYPTVLGQMVDAGKIKVIKEFATDKPGLTGYVVRRDGYQTVVYSDDGYLMLGPLYGPEGKNLSKRYKRQHASRPDIAQTLNGLDSEHLITEGSADAPTLYVFVDPNCIFCQKLYRLVKPLISAGRLQVRWILVGVLGSSSVGRAATILSADDPAGMLARNKSNFDVTNEEGGVTPQQPDDELAGALDRHRSAMLSIGGQGTPVVLFRDPAGHWQSRQGLPPAGWLAEYAQSKPDEAETHQ